VKYNMNQISKTLDKLFSAGFNTEKKITSMQMEDLLKIQDITSVEMNIIIEFKGAIKSKKIIAFLSGCDEKGNKINE
jgi:NAD-dependent DNA ligase